MKVEKLSNNRAKFTFEITPEEFDHGLDHAFAHIKDSVEIKGFRKGKVTRSQYENKFGVESLYEDALNHVIYHKYSEMASYKEVEVVGQPKIELDISKVEKGKSFELVLDAPIRPEIKLPKYKGIEVTKEDISVTDDEIEEQLNQLLSHNETLIPVEEGSLKEGHIAILDYEGFVDEVAFEGGKGENHQLEIGSNQFIPGFEEQMVGMNIGDKRDLKVKFPDEYHSKDLEGKEAIFKVHLHEIKEKQLPILDDEFVLNLKRDGITTVDSLKEDIKKNLLEAKEQNAKVKVAEDVLNEIIKSLDVELPEEMVSYEVEQAKKQIEQQAKQYGIDYEMYVTLSGLDKDQLEDQLKEQAKNRILNSLVIEEVAKAEKIVATEEEVANKFEEFSKQYNMPVEEIKKYIQNDQVEQEVVFTKAIDFLVENAVSK